jgi:hypothetical protein
MLTIKDLSMPEIDDRAVEAARMAMIGVLKDHFGTPLGALPVDLVRRAVQAGVAAYAKAGGRFGPPEA